MRAYRFALLPLALATMPLAGQGFEGTMVMKITGDQSLTMNWTMKGPMNVVTIPYNAPQVGQVEVKVITDNTAQTSTFLAPLPPQFAQMLQGAAGIKMVSDLKAAPAPAAGTPAAVAPPRKLGTSQTIAGFQCDDYEMADSLKTRACLSSALGKFTFPSMGGAAGARGGRGGGMGAMMGVSLPGWASGLNGPGFPLKVWTPSNGKVLMEMVSITKGAVPSDAFNIPDGYVDLGAMGAMMRGGRGGSGGH